MGKFIAYILCLVGLVSFSTQVNADTGTTSPTGTAVIHVGGGRYAQWATPIFFDGHQVNEELAGKVAGGKPILGWANCGLYQKPDGSLVRPGPSTAIPSSWQKVPCLYLALGTTKNFSEYFVFSEPCSGSEINGCLGGYRIETRIESSIKSRYPEANQVQIISTLSRTPTTIKSLNRLSTRPNLTAIKPLKVTGRIESITTTQPGSICRSTKVFDVTGRQVGFTDESCLMPSSSGGGTCPTVGDFAETALYGVWAAGAGAVMVTGTGVGLLTGGAAGAFLGGLNPGSIIAGAGIGGTAGAGVGSGVGTAILGIGAIHSYLYGLAAEALCDYLVNPPTIPPTNFPGPNTGASPGSTTCMACTATDVVIVGSSTSTDEEGNEVLTGHYETVCTDWNIVSGGNDSDGNGMCD